MAKRRGGKKSRARQAKHAAGAKTSGAAKTSDAAKTSSAAKTSGAAKSKAGRVAAWKVALLLFGSGACALIYQIAWLREFRLIFGVSTTASAAVLAIFMGGLGAGTFVLGKRVDSSPRPLAFYARLEVGIAIFTVATPLLLALVRTIYVSLGGTATMGSGLGTVVRLLLASLVLVVPTMLMGGSLPAAARALVSDSDEHRGKVGLVYGINTLGSVVGCMLATFVLLEALGTRTTLWVACAANVTLATVAYLLSRPLDAIAVDKPATETDLAEQRAPRISYFIASAAALVGFVFFLMELVWYRLLGPILGGTVFTFGLVLATALLGIGIGGALYAFLAPRKLKYPLRVFGYTCLAEGLALATPFLLGDTLALWAAQLSAANDFGFKGAVLGWFVITALMVLVPAIIAGAQFPLLIAAMGRGRKAVGKQMGIVYLANTLGAIGGSLAGVFGFMQLFSVRGSWQLSTSLLVLLALAAFLASDMQSGIIASSRRRVLTLSAAFLVVLLVFVPNGPSSRWRHGGIGAGRAGFADLGPNDWRRLKHYTASDQMWEVDGVESSVALYSKDGLSFFVNGKSDGNTITDAPTTIMLGLLPAILHPTPKRSLVIGLGTGMTAGWLAESSGTEQVDVVELEPAILKVAEASSDVNFNVLENPKVQVAIADAREFLLTTRERYEVIVSEPSNPYRSGIASLFTQEFYRSVSSRLTDDGIFFQWVQGYEVDDMTIGSVQVTLLSVFPHVETWQIARGDLVYVASKEPIDYDLARMRERLERDPFAQALSSVLQTQGLEGLLGRYVANADFTRAVANAPGTELNTDDHNIVEFGFARTLGKKSKAFRIVDLRNAAHQLKMNRPPIHGGDVDWNRVDDAELAMMVGEVTNAQFHSHFSTDQLSRFKAQNFYVRGDFPRALAAWSQQAEEPRGPSELTLVAESLAEAGNPSAKHYAGELAAIAPASAHAIHAKLAISAGDPRAAGQSLAEAIQLFRAQPWTPRGLMLRTLDLFSMLSLQAKVSLKLLDEPFAQFKVDRQRRYARVTLAMTLPGDVCIDAFADFEPYVPWDEKFLRQRVECYERNNYHRLAKVANDDLQSFLANDSY